jgi:rRNA maturation RNase YbeY
MILFHYELDFTLENEKHLKDWITDSIGTMGKEFGEINYIFCDDVYLLALNQQYLQHDTLTDIISFDYSVANILSGDIYISIPRVRENADIFKVSFEEELRRVLIHGVLHYAGFKDKTKEEAKEMRKQEDKYISLKQ